MLCCAVSRFWFFFFKFFLLLDTWARACADSATTHVFTPALICPKLCCGAVGQYGRFVVQNTKMFAPTSTLSTAALPFQPVGQYALNVTVVGFGLENVCQPNSTLTLTVDPLNSFVQAEDSSVVVSVTPFFQSLTPSACRVTWSCNPCQLNMNVKTLPTFTLMNTRPSWANLYGFNFSTPAYATATGEPLPKGSVLCVGGWVGG
jgi:hypothetical protein